MSDIPIITPSHITRTSDKNEVIHIDLNSMYTKAVVAMERAYVPYSGFSVGASVMGSNGLCATGANIENASYGLSCCAERVAIYSAIHSGIDTIIALCVTGNTPQPISPCGACRQTVKEFADTHIVILLTNNKGDTKMLTLEELLPYSFGKEHLT